ncbi:MAG: PKD domain-containing protein, partial [Thermoanaerobaculaceae bacterium]
MSTGAKVRLTRTISMAVMVGMAAMANAGDGGDSVSAMRELAARFDRAQTALPVAVSPAATGGSGFARAYGGTKADNGYFMAQVGNNYVFWGTTQSFGLGTFNPWLTELDGNGNLVLQQVWGTAQTETGVINPTPDGGFFVSLVSQPTPGQAVLQLVKLNSSLTSVWQKQYGTGSEGLKAAAVLKDNSFLIEGSTVQISGSTVTYVGTLIKTDSSGNILWQKQSSSSQPVTLAFGQLSDGSYIGVGTTSAASNPADTDILVVKLDASGNVTWQKSYGGSAGSSAYSALPISGGYLIAGSTTAFGAGKSDVWLIQIDTSGNVVKQETIGGAGDDAAVLQAVTGGYLLSGYTDSSGAGSSDGWMAFLDSNLNVTSSKTYGGSGADELFALPDSTGGFLLMGTTSSFGGGGENAWVIKTDASGDPVWQNAYGGTGDESGEIARLSGGGLMLSGSTTSWGAGGTDMLAVLLDSNGQLPGCDLVHPTSVTPVNFPVTVTATNVTPVTTTIAETNATVTASTISLSPITTTATVTDICGATGALTATASASATSGTAPLSVNFTGSAAGGTSPYTYSWNFGDGSAQSTQQNPTHSYSASGSYTVVLKVTDAASATATDSHLQINVSAATCTSPSITSQPLGQSIQSGHTATLTVTATGTASLSYQWYQGTSGDTSHPVGTNSSSFTTPTLTAITSYWVRVSNSCGHADSVTATIMVGVTFSNFVWVPVASHASGLNSSQWRSDLGLLNPGTVTANVQIEFFGSGGMVSNTASVAAGAQSILDDVVGVGLLNSSGSGALEVTSSQPLRVT